LRHGRAADDERWKDRGNQRKSHGSSPYAAGIRAAEPVIDPEQIVAMSVMAAVRPGLFAEGDRGTTGD
jgi:hypothetical protein